MVSTDRKDELQMNEWLYEWAMIAYGIMDKWLRNKQIKKKLAKKTLLNDISLRISRKYLNINWEYR